MPWVKIDDGFSEHIKMVEVGPLGMALQMAALCYCNHHLTDGYVPGSVAKRLIDLDGMPVTFGQLAKKMIDAGVWTVDGDGYRIHDYLEFQPSKDQVMAEREQKRSAGAKGGQASAQARASARGKASAQAGASADAQSLPQAESKPVPVPDPVPVPHPEGDNPSLRSGFTAGRAAGATGTPAEVIPPGRDVQTPQRMAQAAYDLLNAAGHRPPSQKWVGRAIGQINSLTPAARPEVVPAVQWAIDRGLQGYIGTWVVECNWPKLISAYQGQARAAPANEPAGFAGIRDYERMRQAGGGLA